MTYQFSDEVSTIEFDKFVNEHDLRSILQYSSWASVKSEWNHRLCGVYKDGKLVAASLLLIRSLPMSFTFGYMPRGPLMDFNDTELCEFYFKSMKKLAKKLHMISIKFDPKDRKSVV